ncbi:hypothetical protein QEN19_001761 [Hanseniaspora menglaensis]
MSEEADTKKLDLEDINKLLDNKNISFPSNKIKRIIQLSDEDIGKQTSITPTVVSHAILMFISKLVLESCDIIKEESQKKNNKLDLNVLNRCIRKVEEFDFLIDDDVDEEYKEEVMDTADVSGDVSEDVKTED